MTEQAPGTPHVGDDVLRVAEAVHADEVTVAFKPGPTVHAKVGQALLEQCVYDADSGQLLTGSFMDYAIPRADDLPHFKVSHTVTPCTHNPLGAKGCGEAGTVGAAPAYVNAVLNALAPYGVAHIDMPVTPLKVWEITKGRAA